MKCLKMLFTLVLLVSIITVLLLLYFQDQIQNYEKSLYQNRKELEKLVLLWTPMFGSSSLRAWKHSTRLNPAKLNCKYKCRYTVDRSKLEISSAVIYHGFPEGKKGTMFPLPLKKSRNSNQVWVYLSREPPLIFANVIETLNDSYDFNWTVTYRSDSDIFYPYGRFEDIPTEETRREREILLEKANSQSNGVLAVALISECNRPSGRDQYMQELSKTIPIDLYGSCGNLTCPQKLDCYKILSEQKYKFWLSFENSLCLDYVTEKFYLPLKYGLVPVYLGHPQNLKDVPTNSFIHTKDFESPKQLGEYLLYLDKNPYEYLKYFHWRKSKRVTRDSSVWCKLCQKLHEINSGQSKSYKNISEWLLRNNTQESMCMSSKSI